MFPLQTNLLPPFPLDELLDPVDDVRRWAEGEGFSVGDGGAAGAGGVVGLCGDEVKVDGGVVNLLGDEVWVGGEFVGLCGDEVWAVSESVGAVGAGNGVWVVNEVGA